MQNHAQTLYKERKKEYNILVDILKIKFSEKY